MPSVGVALFFDAVIVAYAVIPATKSVIANPKIGTPDPGGINGIGVGVGVIVGIAVAVGTSVGVGVGVIVGTGVAVGTGVSVGIAVGGAIALISI